MERNIKLNMLKTITDYRLKTSTTCLQIITQYVTVYRKINYLCLNARNYLTNLYMIGSA